MNAHADDVRPVPAESRTTGKRNNSSSLRRALYVLTYIADRARGGARPSLPDLATGTGLPKSTLKRLVEPLIEHGLIRYDAQSGRYDLGPYTASLGGIYLTGLDIRNAARPILEDLTQTARETSHLLTLTGTGVVCIDKVDSPNPVRMYSWIGNRLPLYCTAGGKALLAYQPETTFRQVVDAGLDRLTPRTITFESQLHAELEQVRAEGVAVDEIENQEGIRCVGAPILVPTGAPIMAISVSGPTTRMTPERIPELKELVRQAAGKICAQLGGTETST